MKSKELTNYGDMSASLFLDETLISGWREDAWARSLGFQNAADYHQASDEAFQEAHREYSDAELNGLYRAEEATWD